MSSYTSGLRYRGRTGYRVIPESATEDIELGTIGEETPLLDETVTVAEEAGASIGLEALPALGGAVGSHADILYRNRNAIKSVLTGKFTDLKGNPIKKPISERVKQLGVGLFNNNFYRSFPENLKLESEKDKQDLLRYYNHNRRRLGLSEAYPQGNHFNYVKSDKILKTERKGLTVPGYKYLGPGNSLNRGTPNNNIDEDAKEHDEAYNKAKTSQEVSEADKKFISKAGDHIVNSINQKESISNTIGGVIGAVGIGLKSAVEKHTGVIYPSIVSGMSQRPYRQLRPEYANHPSYLNIENRPDYESIINDPKFDSLFMPRSSTGNTQSSQEPGTSRQIDSSEADVPNKRQRPNTPSQSEGATQPEAEHGIHSADTEVPQESSPQDIEMGLPGTGREQANGGAGSDGQQLYAIERPITIFGTTISKYVKSHKFMIFGIANAVLGPTGTTSPQHRILTTCLAEVPWQKLPLYLNESEFNLLPPNTKVIECRVDVVFRGTRIAFETSSSATGLATLNQVSNLQVGVGLNKTGWGLNRFYNSFAPSQPMIPATALPPVYQPSVSNPVYRGMVADYYGVSNESTEFGPNGQYPHHQTGSWTFLRNYWCMYTQSATGTEGPRTGWPCLQEKLQQYDAKTVVNKNVATATYKPKFGYIKRPSGYLPVGYPITAGPIGVGEHLANSRIATIVTGIPNEATTTSTETNGAVTRTQISADFTFYDDIEKSQNWRFGPWGNNSPQVQPSVHIGVQAVPALTTAALNGPLNAWTDSMGYIDVTATLIVENEAPTHFPYATTINVAPNSTAFRTTFTQNPNNSTFNGLYTSTSTLPSL